MYLDSVNPGGDCVWDPSGLTEMPTVGTSNCATKQVTQIPLYSPFWRTHWTPASRPRHIFIPKCVAGYRVFSSWAVCTNNIAPNNQTQRAYGISKMSLSGYRLSPIPLVWTAPFTVRHCRSLKEASTKQDAALVSRTLELCLPWKPESAHECSVFIYVSGLEWEETERGSSESNRWDWRISLRHVCTISQCDQIRPLHWVKPGDILA